MEEYIDTGYHYIIKWKDYNVINPYAQKLL